MPCRALISWRFFGPDVHPEPGGPGGLDGPCGLGVPQPAFLAALLVGQGRRWLWHDEFREVGLLRNQAFSGVFTLDQADDVVGAGADCGAGFGGVGGLEVGDAGVLNVLRPVTDKGLDPI